MYYPQKGTYKLCPAVTLGDLQLHAVTRSYRDHPSWVYGGGSLEVLGRSIRCWVENDLLGSIG
jgi:hypothetical protein